MFVDSLIDYVSPPDCRSPLSVKQLVKLKDIVQSLSNMCIFGVCYAILTKQHTSHIEVSDAK